MWAVPLQNKNSQTATQEFSYFLSTSKRKPLKVESDRGAEFYNSIFGNFPKVKDNHHFNRCTSKGPSISDRAIRTIKTLLKKPVLEKERLID